MTATAVISPRWDTALWRRASERARSGDAAIANAMTSYEAYWLVGKRRQWPLAIAQRFAEAEERLRHLLA